MEVTFQQVNTISLHLLVGVQDGQQQVMRGELSALLLQREARQEATILVVALGGLFTQPQHGEGVGLAGTQRRRGDEEENRFRTK